MTTRIKVVPDATPNADGEWLEIALDLPRLRWKFMKNLVTPFIPIGYHIVAVERGPPCAEAPKS